MVNQSIKREREMEQQRCNRCCLNQSMRVVNLVVNFCGVGMIVYSLWLQKMWVDGVSKVFSPSSLPTPWFDYACLGVGIAVCFSTLMGYMVANSVNKSTLCIYLISLCFLVLLQVGMTVIIFFMIDWGSQIAKCIDEHHKKFNTFVIIHMKICRFIVIMAIVLQIKVVVLAAIIWAKAAEPRGESYGFVRRNFTQSFLVIPDPSLSDCLIESCRKCEEMDRVKAFCHV